MLSQQKEIYLINKIKLIHQRHQEKYAVPVTSWFLMMSLAEPRSLIDGFIYVFRLSIFVIYTYINSFTIIINYFTSRLCQLFNHLFNTTKENNLMGKFDLETKLL